MSARFRVPCLVLIAAMVSGTAFAVPTMNEAANLLRTGQADRAAEAYEAILAEDPENDIAWFQLAMAYHTAGRLEDAVAADTKAATFPRVRFSALYNLACAQSLLGDKDAAAATLQTALDAGFLDYDLVKTDPDLEGVRDKLKRELPHARTYTPFRGANGVKLAYSVLLPQGYDPAKTYPALFAFPPGSGGPATADWAVANLWGESNTQGWIVVVPVAPEDGWISHPAHHALEDLLDQILETHRIQDKQFHLAGFSEGGRPACTYSGMSGKYFKTLLLASSSNWARWDDDELATVKVPVYQWVGSEDEGAMLDAERAETHMKPGNVSVSVIEGEGHLLPSLHNGAWLTAIAEKVQ